jgi:hypothetical protein
MLFRYRVLDAVGSDADAEATKPLSHFPGSKRATPTPELAVGGDAGEKVVLPKLPRGLTAKRGAAEAKDDLAGMFREVHRQQVANGLFGRQQGGDAGEVMLSALFERSRRVRKQGLFLLGEVAIHQRHGNLPVKFSARFTQHQGVIGLHRTSPARPPSTAEILVEPVSKLVQLLAAQRNRRTRSRRELR